MATFIRLFCVIFIVGRTIFGVLMPRVWVDKLRVDIPRLVPLWRDFLDNVLACFGGYIVVEVQARCISFGSFIILVLRLYVGGLQGVREVLM